MWKEFEKDFSDCIIEKTHFYRVICIHRIQKSCSIPNKDDTVCFDVETIEAFFSTQHKIMHLPKYTLIHAVALMWSLCKHLCFFGQLNKTNAKHLILLLVELRSYWLSHWENTFQHNAKTVLLSDSITVNVTIKIHMWLNTSYYEWVKRTKFLLAVIYGSPRRHSNSFKLKQICVTILGLNHFLMDFSQIKSEFTRMNFYFTNLKLNFLHMNPFWFFFKWVSYSCNLISYLCK